MFIATGYAGTPSSKITLKVIPNAYWLITDSSVTYFGEHHTRGEIRMSVDPATNQENIRIGDGSHIKFFPPGTFRGMMMEWLNVDYEDAPPKKVSKPRASNKKHQETDLLNLNQT